MGILFLKNYANNLDAITISNIFVKMFSVHAEVMFDNITHNTIFLTDCLRGGKS